MPDVSHLKEIGGFAPAQGHVDQFQVGNAVPGLVCQALKAVQAYRTSESSKFAVALFRLVIAGVQATDFNGVLALYLGQIILPSVMTLLSLPTSTTPNAAPPVP